MDVAYTSPKKSINSDFTRGNGENCYIIQRNTLWRFNPYNVPAELGVNNSVNNNL